MSCQSSVHAAALAGTLMLIGPQAATATDGGNQVSNASFEVEGLDGPETTYTGRHGGGHSAALHWGVFNNTKGTTCTALLPTTLEGGGERMIHISTDGAKNGISQAYLPFGEGPVCVHSSAWIFVVRGRAYIGAGNGGNTGPNAFTTTTGQWELIEGDNIVCPTNTFIIYSDPSEGGAEFFVDLASVDPFDCPGPAGDLDGSGFVDFGDLLILLSSWGECPPEGECPADLNGDGTVDFSDLLLLLHTWGDCME